MVYIKRDTYLQQLISSMWNTQIKIITGIRRSGKSFLLFNIFKNYLLSTGVKEENIISISLEKKINEKYRNCDNLAKYLREQVKDKRKKYFIFLDEIQYAISKKELKKHYDAPIELYGVLNELIHMNNVDVYVTGSNSKLLSKDVMTEFRGRGYVINVYPLSFREYFSYIKGNVEVAFKNYYLYGGLPFIFKCNTDEEKVKYLKSLFEEVYFKDVSERYNIKYLDIMKEITYLLSSNTGSLTNVNKIVNTLKGAMNIKVSNKMAYNYIQYLQDAFLFSSARRYDVKGRKYLDSPIKYYSTDIGLRNSVLNFREIDESHIMENIIYNELIIRGFSVDVGVVAIRETTEKKGKKTVSQKNCEIDFIVNRGMNKYYIQSALYLDDEKKKKQEFRPLLAIKDFFKKIIITKSEIKPWFDERGILRIGILDFLLNDKVIDI